MRLDLRITASRTLAVATTVLLAAPAWACPSCAGREGGGMGEVVMLGVGIVMPFVVALVMVPTIRKASDQGLDSQLAEHIEKHRGVA